jgi:hypothetical protein
LCKIIGDRGFAAADAAGETNDQHIDKGTEPAAALQAKEVT